MASKKLENEGQPLQNWHAKRAGGRITVYHSSGKLVGVDQVELDAWRVIATMKDGTRWHLDTGNRATIS